MLPSEKEGNFRSSWKTFSGKTLSESWDLGGREGRNGVRERREADPGNCRGGEGKRERMGFGIWDEDEGQGAVGKEGMERERVCVG